MYETIEMEGEMKMWLDSKELLKIKIESLQRDNDMLTEKVSQLESFRERYKVACRETFELEQLVYKLESEVEGLKHMLDRIDERND